MLGSEDLAGLQMGLGIKLKWALEGKHTKRSAAGAPLVSLPLMILRIVFSLCFQCSFLSYGMVWFWVLSFGVV